MFGRSPSYLVTMVSLLKSAVLITYVARTHHPLIEILLNQIPNILGTLNNLS